MNAITIKYTIPNTANEKIVQLIETVENVIFNINIKIFILKIYKKNGLIKLKKRNEQNFYFKINFFYLKFQIFEK